MEFKTLFKYRKLYMGFAMVLLFVHHGRQFIPPGRINDLVAFLYGGVDFFLFCSGIGCFFSYTSDRNPVAFLKRRALRILPVYLAFMIYWMRGFFHASIPLEDILGNLLWVQWLTGREPVFNWYMSALLITYLLTPVLASLAEWADNRLRAAGILFLLLLFTICFWNTDQLVIITTRIPLFFTGMLFAAESRRRDRIERWELFFLLGLMLAGLGILWKVHAYQSEILLWNYGMYWYPFLLIIPGVCLLLSLAASALEHMAPGRWLIAMLSFIGGYTFEIFITHCYALSVSVWHYFLFSVIYATLLHLASLAIKKAAELAVRTLRGRNTDA